MRHDTERKKALISKYKLTTFTRSQALFSNREGGPNTFYGWRIYLHHMWFTSDNEYLERERALKAGYNWIRRYEKEIQN